MQSKETFNTSPGKTDSNQSPSPTKAKADDEKRVIKIHSLKDMELKTKTQEEDLVNIVVAKLTEDKCKAKKASHKVLSTFIDRFIGKLDMKDCDKLQKEYEAAVQAKKEEDIKAKK